MEKVKMDWLPSSQICTHCGKEVGHKVVYGDVTFSVTVNLNDSESKAKAIGVFRAIAEHLEQDAAKSLLVTSTS